MALQPLQDNAGAGLSLLDAILHARVSSDGVVGRTVTRVAVVASSTSSTPAPGTPALPPPSLHEAANELATWIRELEPEATGIIVSQMLSLWMVLELSPESWVHLARRLAQLSRAPPPRAAEQKNDAADVDAAPDASLGAVRVVGVVEDCPTRLYPPLAHRSVSLPSDMSTEGDVEPTSAAAAMFTQFGTIAQQMLAAPATARDSFQERFQGMLPSDERIQAMAQSDQHTSIVEWLELFDYPLRVDLHADDVYPLPPRIPY